MGAFSCVVGPLINYFTQASLVTFVLLWCKATRLGAASSKRHPLMLGRDNTESLLVERGERTSVSWHGLVIKILAVSVANKSLRLR